tara:strand:+ start:263 stop:412 length:150 start_codon:yes stop_codon:yes gene_type:complete
LGFWSGVVVGSTVYYITRDISSSIYMPLASAAASWIADHFLGALMSLEK